MGEISIAKYKAVTIASIYLETKHTPVEINKAKISTGVYLRSAVTEVIHGQIYAPILNVTETDFLLPREVWKSGSRIDSTDMGIRREGEN